MADAVLIGGDFSYELAAERQAGEGAEGGVGAQRFEPDREAQRQVHSAGAHGFVATALVGPDRGEHGRATAGRHQGGYQFRLHRSRSRAFSRAWRAALAFCSRSRLSRNIRLA